MKTTGLLSRVLWVAGLAASGACSRVDSATTSTPTAPPAVAQAGGTFACDDSEARADGTRRTAACRIGVEYCYEATGGPAVSHGATCRPLPAPEATCADLVKATGGGCEGTPATGLRVQFTFP